MIPVVMFVAVAGVVCVGQGNCAESSSHGCRGFSVKVVMIVALAVMRKSKYRGGDGSGICRTSCSGRPGGHVCSGLCVVVVVTVESEVVVV